MAATPNETWDTSMKWGEMGFGKKMIFLGKLAIAMMTFGFAFPRVIE